MVTLERRGTFFGGEDQNFNESKIKLQLSSDSSLHNSREFVELYKGVHMTISQIILSRYKLEKST